MKLLDLFTGTGSVRVVAEALGYEVTSLDIDPRTFWNTLNYFKVSHRYDTP